MTNGNTTPRFLLSHLLQQKKVFRVISYPEKNQVCSLPKEYVKSLPTTTVFGGTEKHWYNALTVSSATHYLKKNGSNFFCGTHFSPKNVHCQNARINRKVPFITYLLSLYLLKKSDHPSVHIRSTDPMFCEKMTNFLNLLVTFSSMATALN